MESRGRGATPPGRPGGAASRHRHVLTRSAPAGRLALALGAASAGDADAPPPEPLDAAILFAPVGDLVPVALAALDRGGTLAVAGVHLSDIPVRIGIRPTTTPYPFAEADRALADLAGNRVTGAGVLRVSPR